MPSTWYRIVKIFIHPSSSTRSGSETLVVVRVEVPVSAAIARTLANGLVTLVDSQALSDLVMRAQVESAFERVADRLEPW